MDHSRANNSNGIAPHYQQQAPYVPPDHNGSHSAQQQSHSRQHHSQRQPFTLNEALPYTPFTSILPFDTDLINTPIISAGSLAPSVAGLVSREDYDSLNDEARNPGQSKRVEGSLEYVQHLLKPEKITQFNFKASPKLDTSGNSTVRHLTDGLSPFAKLIYDNTAISFKQSIPAANSHSETLNGQTMSPVVTRRSPKVKKHAPPKVVKHNPAVASAQAAAQEKSNIEIHLPSKKELAAETSPSMSKHAIPQSMQPPEVQTVSLADLMVKRQSPPPILPDFPQIDHEPLQPLPPKQEPIEEAPITAHLPQAIEVEIPAVSFDKTEFTAVPDSPDAPLHLSARKQKRVEMGDEGDALIGEVNAQQQANATFHDLRRCFQGIFEAEDQITSGQASGNHLVNLTTDQEPTMSTAAHVKAYSLISRSMQLHCFRQVPIDDLLRIQNLCDAGLKHADNLELKVEDSWGETEVTIWAQQLDDVIRGLRAGRTALSIMCGGREEKQLYSEDLIQQTLNLFKTVVDGIIIPIAELRSSGPSASLFKHLLTQKKLVGTVYNTCQKLFSSMTELATSMDLSDNVVTSLEFTSSQLVFVENAHSEKDSVVGVQKFDAVRMVAMDMLAQIFLSKPGQRQGIFDDIMTSLEKLPVGRLSARQFKLSDGGSIQPVSALIMRLIQASAGKVDDQKERSRGQIMHTLEEQDEDRPQETTEDTEHIRLGYTIKTEDSAALQYTTAIQELQDLTKPLMETAQRNANYVINFMVKRALKSTKTGDTPYRNLLDLFVEDFTTCLDSPDWPAAELLLRVLMFMMAQLIEGDKNSAPAKNMALELLGVMAAAISKLRSHVRKIAGSFEGTTSDELGLFLADLASSALEGKPATDKILSWTGPYRIVLEYLEGRQSDDHHLAGSISFLVSDWGAQLCSTFDSENEDEIDRGPELGRTAYRLRKMVEDRRWLTKEYSFKTVAASHAKLSNAIMLLRSSFCGYFRHILNILMGSMTTDQATVRSRSIKSIHQVLDTDPTILDGDSVVIDLILQCSNDSSPQVRDSALGLIGKCINMRPRLEDRMTETVVQRFVDSGVGVRKRAMKLARDIYLRNQNKGLRSAIASGLLMRTQDPDEGVRELAKLTIEEIWIAPFYKADDSMTSKQSLTDHVSLMVQTVKHGNSALVLDKVLQTILSPEAKLSDANSQVCTKLVANMFELVDNPDSDDALVPSGKDALQVLMIFAKADPKLFTFEQITLLKPHAASMKEATTAEGIAISRAVMVIYRRVLPQVSSVHSDFLIDVRNDLIKSTGKVGRTLLDDVIACIWIISGLLQSKIQLSALVSSALAALQPLRARGLKGPLDTESVRKLDRYSLIVGMAGKHCDLDSEAEAFKARFPKWQGGSVSKLMIDVLYPFVSPSQPKDVRRPALDAIGLVCQSNPRNYVSANVYTTFQQVFDEQNPVLESTVLRSIKEFLVSEEKRSEQVAAANKDPAKKDLKVMASTGFDDVASATTQRFLKEITRITLATLDEQALLAMEVLGSINRQGLVHPKETGVTLITLETCPVPRISELAYHEHRALHEKHETVLEREYAKAIQSAFQYQRDVCQDPRGATENPFAPKLHLMMEVLKISKSKNRQRFLEKLVGQVDFEPAKLDTSQSMPSHVEFSRFVLENMAFFEYVTIGEVQATIAAMEKLVSGTGSSIAHTIDADIFQVRLDLAATSQQAQDAVDPVSGMPLSAPPLPSVDLKRLRRLTAASMIVSTVWETRTYLRRLYGQNSHRRDNKAKSAAKDLSKAPVKIPSVTGDKFWEDTQRIMTALDSQERMMEQCRSFVELLNVDNELKVADEEELDADGDPQTPEADDDDENGTPDTRGRKRKASSTPGGRKKRARSTSRARARARPSKIQASDLDAEADMDDDEVPWM